MRMSAPSASLRTALSKFSSPGFIVGRVDEHAIFGFEAESEASLGMIEPCRLDSHPVHVEAAVFNVAKLAAGAHLVHIHGEVGRFHLLGHDLLETGLAAGGMKEEWPLGLS